MCRYVCRLAARRERGFLHDPALGRTENPTFASDGTKGSLRKLKNDPDLGILVGGCTVRVPEFWSPPLRAGLLLLLAPSTIAPRQVTNTIIIIIGYTRFAHWGWPCLCPVAILQPIVPKYFCFYSTTHTQPSLVYGITSFADPEHTSHHSRERR
jgi:hypothetical protein